MLNKYKDKINRAKEGLGKALNDAKSKTEELIGSDDPDQVSSWCSWCGDNSDHHIYESSKISRSIYICSTCSKTTVKCRFCENMARASGTSKLELESQNTRKKKLQAVEDFFTENWSNELCAEHDGSIPDFSKANDTISEVGEFKALMKPCKPNIYGNAKKYGAIAGGVVAVGTGAWVAAPGIAAALGTTGALGAASTGTAISSLSGAALTSASLAQLGAGGLAVIAAAGAGLGGQTGYGLANAYLKDIPDYDFSFKRGAVDDSGHRVIFVNGFLTESDKDAFDWYEGLSGKYNSSQLWYLNWEAKTLHKLGKALGTAARDVIVREAFKAGVAAGSKAMAQSVARGGFVLAAANLGANPWHSAMLNAEKAGALLAEAIARCEGKTFTLMGHSLGARVVHFALQALSTKSEAPRVTDAILMGGAVGNSDRKSWEMACSAVSGTLYNCHSDNDGILSSLYRLANAMQSNPAGLMPTGFAIDNLKEVDFTDLIEGHNYWKQHLPQVLSTLGLGD